MKKYPAIILLLILISCGDHPIGGYSSSGPDLIVSGDGKTVTYSVFIQYLSYVPLDKHSIGIFEATGPIEKKDSVKARIKFISDSVIAMYKKLDK